MREYIVDIEDWNGSLAAFDGIHNEVIRCRDCRFEMNGYCSRPDEWIDELWFPVEPDGFCKWGERNEPVAEPDNVTESETNGITLLPCPFCGSEAIDFLFDELRDPAVVCDASAGGCGAASGYKRTIGEAIEAWNRRAGQQSCI